MRIRWLRVLRDVIIVIVLRYVGAFIVALIQGMVTTESLFVSSLLLGTLGFCLCGCLTIENRWKHLFIVALGVWLIIFSYQLALLAFLPFNVLDNVLAWVRNIFSAFVPMVLGGYLSMVLVKASKQKDVNNEQKQ
jgi:hypothetical protein